MTTVFRRLRRDDDGSIPLALLITVIGVGLSTVLAAVVLTQVGTTRHSQTQLQALTAAQAGIDVALGHFKAASTGVDSNGDPIGDVSMLPCGVFEGRVAGADSPRYSVEVRYLRADPQGKDPAVDGGWFTANGVACIGGRPVEVPAYAFVDATGVDPATQAQRRLTGTHVFKTTNENIPGGLVHVYQVAGAHDLCLDAGSDNPTPGREVRVELCSRGNTAQTFAYTKALNLALVSSRQADPTGRGMCVDRGDSNGTGQVLRFQPCVEPPAPSQQWSLNDSANLQGTTNGKDLNGKCLVVNQRNVPGSLVVLGDCGGSYNNWQHWSLDAAVGAGMASRQTGRLVNFKQFARCVDVTKHNVNYEYLIVWPCKQTPSGDVSWNQKWTYRDTGGGRSTISTRNGSTDYCLRSPEAAGGYVRVARCDGSSAQRWTVFEGTGAYHTSYTIVDSTGLCLTPTDPEVDPHFEGDGVSKLAVGRCDGSPLQKWNAPPDLGAATTLKDLAER